ncbi:SulP family inorganic anion transporter [Aquimarina brevivitae]|uniref:SulP family sulfate permease n=1 Tax=Aquimarina brevivitae TaxID=323412 RepID=A0A4V2F5T0_9FLAO|nr:solute carrier family 26 protein [Aquimarina brevivitae]RZS93889.1 SulP family sulfate permease [Aquimarina brevivitae]
MNSFVVLLIILKPITIKRSFNIIPFIQTLRDYSFSSLKGDAIAGITVGVILIPQAVAYAMLMGAPPIYGLYASLVPLMVYAIFGSSKYLSIGPVAITAILLMNGVSELATPFSDLFVTFLIVAGLLVGLFQIFLGILRLGFLVNLISQPVLSGFISAAALIIVFSQLGGLLGIRIPKQDHQFESIIYIFNHLGDFNWITTAITIGSMLLFSLIKLWKKSFPSALLLILVTTLGSYYFDLQAMQVAIIGEVPTGLPFVNIPELSIAQIQQLLPTILSVTFIGYVGSIGVAKALEVKKRDHTVRPNQELFALGLAKVIGSLFLAIPTSGSYSRTAINEESGAKTTVSSLVSAFLVVIALLVLTPLFYYIPSVILSVIIVLSVVKLIDVREAIRLFKIRRSDFLVFLITFIVTFFMGMEKGILAGVILSFIFIIYHSSRPHLAELVNIPSTPYYKNRDRFPEASSTEKLLILRFDDQLYFANASYFKEAMIRFVEQRKTKPEFLILDCTNMHDLDSTGLQVLIDLWRYLHQYQIQFLLSGTIGPVRDFLKRSGFTEMIGVDHFFLTINDAVEFTEHNTIDPTRMEFANQTNTKRSLLD